MEGIRSEKILTGRVNLEVGTLVKVRHKISSEFERWLPCVVTKVYDYPLRKCDVVIIEGFKVDLEGLLTEVDYTDIIRTDKTSFFSFATVTSATPKKVGKLFVVGIFSNFCSKRNSAITFRK